jgi:hypothetical protein
MRSAGIVSTCALASADLTIADRQAPGMGNWGTIVKLNLSNNHIHAAGIKAICEVLVRADPRERVCLEELILANNHAGPEGATAIGGVLGKNRVIKKVNLQWNNIGNTGIEAICKSLGPHCKTSKINISFNLFDTRYDAGILLFPVQKASPWPWPIQTLFIYPTSGATSTSGGPRVLPPWHGTRTAQSADRTAPPRTAVTLTSIGTKSQRISARSTPLAQAVKCSRGPAAATSPLQLLHQRRLRVPSH